MPTGHLQKHFWWILCLPSVHTSNNVTAVVSDSGSGMCRARFARDDALHEKEVAALVGDNDSSMCSARVARGRDPFDCWQA